MTELKNISIKKLFRLSLNEFENYHNQLRYLMPKDSINKIQGKELTSLTFGDVITIRKSISNPDIENLTNIFQLVFGMKPRKVMSLKTVQFYQSFNWIKEQIELLTKRENKELSSTPEPKLKMAGIDELNKFGELNTLIALSEKFSTNPLEVVKWNYGYVFSLVWQSKISNDINKRYMKSLTPKK
jgi:hypothetical protein